MMVWIGICLGVLLQIPIAVFTAAAEADERTMRALPLPKHLQGDWQVKSVNLDGKTLREDAWFPPGVPVSTWLTCGVRVSGLHVWSRAASRKQAEESCQIYLVGVSRENPRRIAIIRAGPNGRAPPVLVGYLAGIYKRDGDAVDLCLSYVGQGLEGDAAQRWTWPSEFEVEDGARHYHVRLERPTSEGETVISEGSQPD